MATSGTVPFTQNTTTIVEDAFYKAGILGEGESLSAEQTVRGKRELNRLIKFWQSQGIHLWKYREGILFLEKDQKSYLLGPNGDNATESAVETNLAADAVTGAATITVDDDTGVSSGDYIGIVLDDSTVQWTTVNGAPVANVITLTDVLTGDTSEDNKVVTYTTKVTRPLYLTDARYEDSSTNEITIFENSRTDYFRQSNKDAEGSPTQIYYNPLLNDGKMYVWPTAGTPLSKINFTFIPGFDIFDSSTDDADIPAEWYDALIYGLAERLCPDYGIVDERYAIIKARLEEMLSQLKGFDGENTTVNLLIRDYTGSYENYY